MSRGGKREGAGRKPLLESQRKKSRAVTLRLAMDVADYLSTTDNQTAAVEAAVRESKGYREAEKHAAEIAENNG